ncbi:MAG: amidase [Xanthomonadales bacterium]
MKKRLLILCLTAVAVSSGSFAADPQTPVGPAEHAVRVALERIARWDPDLNAVIAVNPAAVEQAGVLDRERASGAVRGPLHGVPVLIKDNIETRELPTTAGSLALAGNATGRDARLVARLRDQGLVILGKTNLSEWANFRSERSSSGWSAVGGQARNPHDPTRSPCGSSSGSAVAVAAGYVALAVGTETNGSVICPSAVNGIVGIKPTVGLISRHGIVPIAHSQDTAGPMATNVRDAAFLLDAMVAFDPQDPAAPDDRAVFARRYADALDPDGLAGKRIGVVRSLAGFHEGVDAAFERAIADLAAGGAEIVDDLALPPYADGLGDAAYDVLLYEFKHDLNAYLAGLPGAEAALTLQALIEFNRSHADAEMKWFQQEIFLKAQEKGGLDSPAYRDALQRVQSFSRDGIDELLAAHDLDLLISPSNTPAWKIDLIVGDRWLGSSSSFPARAGYPHITVPMGFVHGVPVGLSLYASAFSEPVLIEAAFAYEQRSRRAAPPRGFGEWAPAVETVETKTAQ